MNNNRRNNNNFSGTIKKFDRLHVLRAIFFLFAVILVVRLFDLQLLNGAVRQAEAYNQRAVSRELLPQRGEVYTISSIHNTNELQPLAVNERRFLVYINPNEIKQPINASKEISEILELDHVVLKEKFDKENDPYEPIKHGVTTEIAEQIEQMNYVGVYTKPEMIRSYPMNKTFGHITGFVGFVDDKRVGQYGIEGFLDDLLAGKSGYLESEQDPAGRLIALGNRQLIPAIDGADFVLTIDPNIQQKTCSLIRAVQEKYQASGGTIIVMEPDSGAVRAMCSVPDFDPNNYNEVEDIDVYINSAVTGTYEPGSIFKAVTMAAALDSDSVEADTKFTDIGSVTIGEHIIRNADNQVYGEQTMSQVLENSINTGMVFSAMLTGSGIFRKYVKDFGFGRQTGIEFPAESAGNITSLSEPGDIYLATASFGQGLTVTPIQMVQAFSVIANRGTKVQPYVISKVVMPDGNEISVVPEKKEQVISNQTAAVLSAMLVNVTEKGYGKAAQVPGFYVAGKTGTAQIAGPNGYTDETIHSFVGFAPISKPRFVILVKLDKPQWGRFSSNTVTPVFAELANYLLQYYQIQPER